MLKTPEEGTISNGTLNPEHLIPAFHEALAEYLPEAALAIQAEHQTVFTELATVKYLNGLDPADIMACMEDYDAALNNIAPADMYFGSHPGNGSDIGFWRFDPVDIDDLPWEADETTELDGDDDY